MPPQIPADDIPIDIPMPLWKQLLLGALAATLVVTAGAVPILLGINLGPSYWLAVFLAFWLLTFLALRKKLFALILAFMATLALAGALFYALTHQP